MLTNYKSDAEAKDSVIDNKQHIEEVKRSLKECKPKKATASQLLLQA